MKKNRFIALIIFFSISFSVLHDFTIDLFNEGQDSVSHYVSGTDHRSEFIADGDIDDIHYLFHAPMLLTLYTPFSLTINSSPKIQINPQSYVYNHINTFLKPPIL